VLKLAWEGRKISRRDSTQFSAARVQHKPGLSWVLLQLRISFYEFIIDSYILIVSRVAGMDEQRK
jgi:hypothetical protein